MDFLVYLSVPGLFVFFTGGTFSSLKTVFRTSLWLIDRYHYTFFIMFQKQRRGTGCRGPEGGGLAAVRGALPPLHPRLGHHLPGPGHGRLRPRHGRAGAAPPERRPSARRQPQPLARIRRRHRPGQGR